MISSTFFHQVKVQVSWPFQYGSLQPAFWALGFQGPIDSQSGMIINLKDVMQIQEGFLRNPPVVSPVDWLKQSVSYVAFSIESSASFEASLPFVTALIFPGLKVKLQLFSESLRWFFERQHLFEVGSDVMDVKLRRELQSPDEFLPATEESWPAKFTDQRDLECFLAKKGEFLIKPFLKKEGITSSDY